MAKIEKYLFLSAPDGDVVVAVLALQKYEFSLQWPLWESHGIHQTASGLQICEYWKRLCMLLIYSMLRYLVSQKEQFGHPECSSFEHLWAAFCGLHAVIDIKSWWVGSHIKLGYDLKQNVTEVRTQFDLAVNPLWFNINLKTMVLACRKGWCVLVLECYCQKTLFSMNYFDKTSGRFGYSSFKKYWTRRCWVFSLNYS